MKNELIERYIYAVTKRMPKKLQEDVSAELNSLILDMLEEQYGELSPSKEEIKKEEIKTVLTKLGSPTELAEKYDIDSKKSLIGAPYYTTYKLILKVALICTAFGITLSGLIIQFTAPPQLWYTATLHWFGMVSSGLIFAFALVTLLFAFFSYKEIKLNVPIKLDDLPPVPKSKELIPKRDPILGISFIIIFFIVFLLVPQTIFVILTAGDEPIPIFNEETLKNTWYLIALFGITGIIREIIKLIDGRYTKRVMMTSIIADSLSAIVAFGWLLSSKIINPLFTSRILNIFNEEDKFVTNIFANFQYFLLGTIIFALILDMTTTIIRTKKSQKIPLS